MGHSAIGRSRGDALAAIAHAYRAWALEHPGRYQAAQWAPVPGDTEDETTSDRVVGVVAAVADGFGLPVSVDHSFDRLVSSLEAALSSWGRPSGRRPAGRDSSDVSR